MGKRGTACAVSCKLSQPKLACSEPHRRVLPSRSLPVQRCHHSCLHACSTHGGAELQASHFRTGHALRNEAQGMRCCAAHSAYPRRVVPATQCILASSLTSRSSGAPESWPECAAEVISTPPGLNTPFSVDVKGDETAGSPAGEATCSLPGQLALTPPSSARLCLSRMACVQAACSHFAVHKQHEQRLAGTLQAGTQATSSLPGQLALTPPSSARLCLSRMACMQAAWS